MWRIKTFITLKKVKHGFHKSVGVTQAKALNPHIFSIQEKQRHVKGPSANITQASDLYKYTLHGVNNAETHHST